MVRLFAALAVVVTVYLLSVLVLRLLAAFSPPTATVQGVLRRGDNGMWFTAAGVAGAFIVLAVVALVAVYVFASSMLFRRSCSMVLLARLRCVLQQHRKSIEEKLAEAVEIRQRVLRLCVAEGEVVADADHEVVDVTEFSRPRLLEMQRFSGESALGHPTQLLRHRLFRPNALGNLCQ